MSSSSASDYEDGDHDDLEVARTTTRATINGPMNTGTSSKSTSTTATPAATATTGVADYFAILGVGEKLVWKHTQKQRQQREQQQQQHQQQQQNYSGGSGDGSSSSSASEDDHDDEAEEEDAMLKKRFLREIVDVVIVTGHHPLVAESFKNNSNNKHNAISKAETLSEVSASSSITIPTTTTAQTHQPTALLAQHQKHQEHEQLPANNLVQLEASTSGTTSEVEDIHDPDTDKASSATGSANIDASAISSQSCSTTNHPRDEEGHTADDKGIGGGDSTNSTSSIKSGDDVNNNIEEKDKNGTPSSTDGWDVIQRTLPASRSSKHHNTVNATSPTSTTIITDPTSTGGGSVHAPTLLSSMSSNTLATIQTTTAATGTGGGGGGSSSSHHPAIAATTTTTTTYTNTSHPILSWSRRQVWSANLDWAHGLPGQLLSGGRGYNNTHQQHQNNHHHPEQQPLQGLRKKMESKLESTLRNWRARKGYDGDLDGDEEEAAAMRVPYYMAFKRRHTVDDADRPAIAQVELLYVRVRRSCCLVPATSSSEAPVSPASSFLDNDNSSSSNNSNNKPSFPSSIAGHLLGRYQSAQQARYFTSSPPKQQQEDDDEDGMEGDNDSPKAQKLVPMQEFLTLPENYDEWSIPQDFVWLRDPYSVMVATAAAARNAKPSNKSKKTVFFDHDGGDGADNLGVEAIESVSSSVEEDHSTTTASESVTTGGSSSAAKAHYERYYLPKLVLSHELREDPDYEHYIHIPVLAIRRQQIRDEERYHERDTAIVDLAVSFADHQGQPVLPEVTYADDDYDDDDEEDEAFRLLGKTEWSVASSSSQLNNNADGNIQNYIPNKRPRLGFPVILARKNLPFGFADATFATSVLDRFPMHNYKNLPLPEEELPMFCYPTGCRLHRAQFRDAPLAEYYGFVVKNERGDSIYVSCVSFMEPLTNAKAQQLAQMSEKRRAFSLPHRAFCEERERRKKMGDMLGGNCNDSFSFSDLGGDANFLMTGFDDMTTFEKKTICLVSRFPFWTAFRKFLSHLHILSTSTSELPLERYISHLLLAVPLPKPGGHNIIIPLPALNDPMVLYRPPEKDFPLVDLPYQRLVACLDVKTIVTTVLGLLALERKVIVMSTRPSLVLDVCELLRSLLFPFELCAPYVPRLTEPFQSSLEFPGALFVGIHRDGGVNGLAERVRKNPPEDSILVDLDTGEMGCDGDRYEVISKTWELIPATARTVLVSELETLCRDASIVDGQEPLDSQYDSAFDVALPAAVEDIGLVSGTKEPLDDRAIRDAFLRFFCSVLGGYDRYLVVPDADFLVSGNEWFDSQGFLASVPSERAPYLGALVSTQLFQSFIQRRTEASDVHCLLFDECISEFHSSPVPYGRLGGDVETVPSPYENNSPPQLVYSLLVDQSATLPPSNDSMVLASGNRSMDATSEAGSSLNLSKASISLADYSVKYGEAAVNTSGDLVTAPLHINLPKGSRFLYCVDGNPCFPHKMNPDLFFPREPESWVVELSNKGSTNPVLARSERELEDANRRRRKATSHRGLNRRRCLWQLPKLMGSHFLGAWLLCIPVQVSQQGVSDDQQTRYLMRALGALRLLRSKQRIVPDEAAYRAMMVACGRVKSDRRVELVKLFGLLRSDGIFPSAVTLGQYTRALAEGYSKRSSSSSATQQQEEDYNSNNATGVEVTESASRIGRLSIASMNARPGSSRDVDTILSGLDTSLSVLESHGRRWRHRNGILPGESKSDQKKRSLNKTWLPVVYSTSFSPKIPERQSDKKNDEVAIRLVAMWSRTRGCSNCTYVPLEEEIQAGWDIVGGENDDTIACPRCGALIVPMLGYKEMSLEEALSIESCTDAQNNISSDSTSAAEDFGVLPPQIGRSVDAVADDNASYVAYISPAALRAALEQYVEEMGEEVLSRDRLKELDPGVFYNFWWYCARFSLPLPLPVLASSGRGGPNPLNYCAFAAWDKSSAERGCLSASKVLSPIMESLNKPDRVQTVDDLDLESFDEVPLLSRFNLQGFYSTVWDHVDLSAILVKLVEACDKRDFKPVVEAVLACNRRRKETYDPMDNDANSEVNSAADQAYSEVGGQLSPSVELDVYRTILYLAKYQCTTAFHAFFPATTKPCKGYHFWCAIGTPSPIFDRLFRDAVERIKQSNRDRSLQFILPIQDVSDVAVGFRCVFGHLI